MPDIIQANVSSPDAFLATGGDPRLVSALIANGFDVNSALRTFGLLQKDEWKELDRTIIGVARTRLTGIADLRSRNLVHNLGGLGVLTSEWENISAMGDATVDMGGETPGREDAVVYNTQGVPIPIIHKGYRINIRRLLASRKLGQSIDTIQAAEASRSVTRKLEDMLFNGISLKNDGYSIYGYTTFPQRLRANISAWDGGSADIEGDCSHMIELLAAAGFYGQFVLYVPSNYWAVLQEDYDTYKTGTKLERILRFREIADVKVSDVLGDSEVVMVQMTPDVVDLAFGLDISNVEWNSMGGLVSHMKVMAAMAPRLKYAKHENGSTVSGILHGFEASTSTTTTAA